MTSLLSIGLENAFFSAAFVPPPEVQFPMFRKPKRLRAGSFRIHLPQAKWQKWNSLVPATQSCVRPGCRGGVRTGRKSGLIVVISRHFALMALAVSSEKAFRPRKCLEATSNLIQRRNRPTMHEKIPMTGYLVTTQ